MSVLEKQQEIIDNFNFFDDWSDKYAYLISLGKNLEEFPEDKKTDENFVKGCQSQVWFYSKIMNGKVYYYGTSDAIIVRGLIGLLVEIYSGQSLKDIAESNTGFLYDMELSNHLSPTRNQGLSAMINYIYKFAKKNINE